VEAQGLVAVVVAVVEAHMLVVQAAVVAALVYMVYRLRRPVLQADLAAWAHRLHQVTTAVGEVVAQPVLLEQAEPLAQAAPMVHPVHLQHQELEAVVVGYMAVQAEVLAEITTMKQ
jgi:hypothetical protein